MGKDPTDRVLEADASELPELFEAGGIGKLSARLQSMPLAGDSFLVQGEAQGKLRVECGRCLDKLEQPFEAHFNLLVEKRKETGLEWLDDEDGGVTDYQARIGPDVVEIPLDHIIAEQVLLNYNLHPLPALDPQLRCVQCGLQAHVAEEPKKADRVDPRWIKLKSLKDEASGDKDANPSGRKPQG